MKKNQLTKSVPSGNAVKIGRDFFSVSTLAEAVGCWKAARDQHGWGSEAPPCMARINGLLYRISYNGRVWDPFTELEVVGEPAGMALAGDKNSLKNSPSFDRRLAELIGDAAL